MPNPSVDLLGMVNFYRKLIRQATDMLPPLRKAIKHHPAAKMLELSPAENQICLPAKDIFAKVSALTHPDPDPT